MKGAFSPLQGFLPILKPGSLIGAVVDTLPFLFVDDILLWDLVWVCQHIGVA